MRSVLNESDGMQQRSQQCSVAQHQHRQHHSLDDGSLKQEADVGSGGKLLGSPAEAAGALLWHSYSPTWPGWTGQHTGSQPVPVLQVTDRGQRSLNSITAAASRAASFKRTYIRRHRRACARAAGSSKQPAKPGSQSGGAWPRAGAAAATPASSPQRWRPLRSKRTSVMSPWPAERQ